VLPETDHSHLFGFHAEMLTTATTKRQSVEFPQLQSDIDCGEITPLLASFFRWQLFVDYPQ
jgi:hypothetical protein